MGIWISLALGIFLTLMLGCMFFWLSFLDSKICRAERRIIHFFSSRNDMICALYEILKGEVGRHEEIFKEILELRKKEFSLLTISHNIEGFMKLQTEIHHEINFIFQIANKNPKLLKEKKFLYIREQLLLKSNQIKKILETYNAIIAKYNTHITLKNLSGIGVFLPFSKKETI